jgi:hypothetical protein
MRGGIACVRLRGGIPAAACDLLDRRAFAANVSAYGRMRSGIACVRLRGGIPDAACDLLDR